MGLREALEKACVTEDGRDLLVDAIDEGARSGDETCLELARKYRLDISETPR